MQTYRKIKKVGVAGLQPTLISLDYSKLSNPKFAPLFAPLTNLLNQT